MSITYLALGSNLGNRSEYLQKAVQALPPWVQLISYSPVYETPPWGILEQPPFLNQVVKADTQFSPRALLDFLKKIETNLGRENIVRFGPRVIDLDILFYDNLIFDDGTLVIPHPRLHERAFVLVPMADLAPNYIHPVLGQSISQLLDQVNTPGVVRYSLNVSSQGKKHGTID